MAIIKCPECGCICYAIGARFNDATIFTACTVDEDMHYLPGMGIHLAGAFRFAKTAEEVTENLNKEELQKKLDKAVEIEDYETAEKLKQLLEH